MSVPRCSIAFFSSGSSFNLSAATIAFGNLVLDGEDVGEIAVVAVGPEWPPVLPVDQLGGDAHAVAGLADAAFEHVGHAERPGDLLHVHPLPLNVKAVLRATTEQGRNLKGR